MSYEAFKSRTARFVIFRRNKSCRYSKNAQNCAEFNLFYAIFCKHEWFLAGKRRKLDDRHFFEVWILSPFAILKILEWT